MQDKTRVVRSAAVRGAAFAQTMTILLSALGSVLDREGNSSHSVLAETYDSDTVAKRKDIFHPVDSSVRDLGNMHKAFLSGRKLEERTELLHRNDGSFQNLSFLEVRCNDVDVLLRECHAVRVRAAD